MLQTRFRPSRIVKRGPLLSSVCLEHGWKGGGAALRFSQVIQLCRSAAVNNTTTPTVQSPRWRGWRIFALGAIFLFTRGSGNLMGHSNTKKRESKKKRKPLLIGERANNPREDDSCKSKKTWAVFNLIFGPTTITRRQTGEKQNGKEKTPREKNSHSKCSKKVAQGFQKYLNHN